MTRGASRPALPAASTQRTVARRIRPDCSKEGAPSRRAQTSLTTTAWSVCWKSHQSECGPRACMPNSMAHCVWNRLPQGLFSLLSPFPSNIFESHRACPLPPHAHPVSASFCLQSLKERSSPPPFVHIVDVSCLLAPAKHSLPLQATAPLGRCFHGAVRLRRPLTSGAKRAVCCRRLSCTWTRRDTRARTLATGMAC